MRVAIYARYSSEYQRDASIADQVRICREFVQRQDWMITHEFADHAASGSNVMRAGFQDQMALALRKDVEATLVRRIFTDYLAGASPKQIAKALNAEGVRGPQGALWSPSTIHGNPKRGTGILHNELYVGRLVWNRQRFLRDPETGKRVARPNPQSEWITKAVPELRIINDELWQGVQAPYATVQHKWSQAPDSRLKTACFARCRTS